MTPAIGARVAHVRGPGRARPADGGGRGADGVGIAVDERDRRPRAGERGGGGGADPAGGARDDGGSAGEGHGVGGARGHWRASLTAGTKWRRGEAAPPVDAYLAAGTNFIAAEFMQ